MKNQSLPLGTVLRSRNNTYTIDKVLGQGSFGITYLGSTRMKLTGPLGTIDTEVKVAIKEFFMSDINGRSSSQVTCSSQGGQYDYYRRKFKSEAENLSRLKHDNIINVYESFEANNTVYYVMEYVSGGSLNDYISKKRRLSEDETVGIALQICSALSYMHGRRMLHLDLKPGNVMLHDNGRAVLIDFGLAKQFDSNGTPESSTTIGHGTPGYAPIEQSNYNEDKHHGFPSSMDIYALGGTMFKMLTGKCPPPASDILNEGFPTYELQQISASEDIISIISRAMSPMVANRYKTDEEMVEKLLSISNKQNVGYSSKNESFIDEIEVVDVQKADEMVVKNEIVLTKKGKKLTHKNHSSRKTEIPNSIAGHVYVDLGLSVKWATCNVGAESPEVYGGFYSWGSIKVSTSYAESGYKFCRKESKKNIYYRNNSKLEWIYDELGEISGNPKYDVARSRWGGSWRMPTKSEMEELLDNCDVEYVIFKGVQGALFRSKINKNTIFLPAASYRSGYNSRYIDGYGYYWSSSPKEDRNNSAYCLFFSESGYKRVDTESRYEGLTVRPVSE